MSNNFYGIYLGVVRNNDDPEVLYRLKVAFPSLSDLPLLWAEACLSSTQARIPDIGDAVWIMFEAGDVRRPVWLGVHPTQAA